MTRTEAEHVRIPRFILWILEKFAFILMILAVVWIWYVMSKISTLTTNQSEVIKNQGEITRQVDKTNEEIDKLTKAVQNLAKRTKQ